MSLNSNSFRQQELDRMSLKAFGRTASEAFSRNICVVCGIHPEKFPTDASRREYEEISHICPACWVIETLPPDESIKEIERAKRILRDYDRELVLRQKVPHAWKCLRCNKLIQDEERLTHATDSCS
ncbi:hypothetical protein RclHR1_21800001 [Rhizophagus clarus]|uniref:Uncharacterized protein n=1 Tax=Rhizophagus clarus TaxID=94130 RepID=A0A2Z6RMR0_9GLOM|nr:hypothetical protein RclHR1_21800001 [Rhizophagus clarus]GES89102.1 hypothetical protein GLOIN_2v1471163 [Rhizophagus clarus]